MVPSILALRDHTGARDKADVGRELGPAIDNGQSTSGANQFGYRTIRINLMFSESQFQAAGSPTCLRWISFLLIVANLFVLFFFVDHTSLVCLSIRIRI